VKDLSEQLSVRLVSVTNGCFAELFFGNLVGNVGTAQNASTDAQRVLNHVGDQSESVLIDIDTLDEGDGFAVGRDSSLELLANACDKLGAKKSGEGVISRRTLRSWENKL